MTDDLNFSEIEVLKQLTEGFPTSVDDAIDDFSDPEDPDHERSQEGDIA